MSSLETQFGQVVRAARKRQSWSQERLAEVADLNRSYLGEIERGVVSPSLSTIHKLALALGSSVAALIEHSERAATALPRGGYGQGLQASGGDSL